ncbi:hypothetical protein FNF27_03071 [Cafeteria roenbergensis]|uniref:Sodium/solute symporter n=1 Tax=Cafeteria roenbergensis TaxID=33653 RepID=A0A5A8EHV6_CAFRO|nr:hypothetical protein FNF27_03071 [Cafeteria roenbergensis]
MESSPANELQPLDWAVMGTYVVVVAAVCFLTARASQGAKQFFLADSAASALTVGAAFFASNIGSDSIIGLSSAGATAGISAGFFDIASGLAFVLLAYAFLPVYRHSGVFTLPQWTERRFGPRVRLYLSVLALLIYIVNRISATLYCGGLIFSVTLGLNEWVSIGLLLVATGLTVTAGGLHSVLVIENINTVLLLVCGFATLGFAVEAAGGWGSVAAAISAGSGQAEEAGIPPRFLHMWSGGELYPWQGLLLGGPWLVGWFHLAEQEMVQRGLSAASAGDAALGCIIAGLLKLTIPFTWAVPGLVARYLYPEELGCDAEAPAGAECAEANRAFPVLVMRVLPQGMLGLMLAAMLAAVLSVLASTFNSASTIFVFDVASKLPCLERPPREPREEPGPDLAAPPDASAPPAAGSGEPPPRSRSRQRCRGGSDDVAQSAASGGDETAALAAQPRPAEAPSEEGDAGGVDAHDRWLVLIGRAWVGVMVVLGVAWIPALGRLSDSLYVSMQTLNALLAPPVLAVFVLGALWPRANEAGALAGLVAGHLPGIVRLVLATAEGAGDPAAAASGDQPAAGALGGGFTALNYLYFAAAEGAFSMAVVVAVSMCVAPAKQPRQVAPFGLLAALRCWSRCCPGVGLGAAEGEDPARAEAALMAGCRAWDAADKAEETELALRAERVAESQRADTRSTCWRAIASLCERPPERGAAEQSGGERDGAERKPEAGGQLASSPAAAAAAAPSEGEARAAIPAPVASAAEGEALLGCPEPAGRAVSAPRPSEASRSAVRASQTRLSRMALAGAACLVAGVAALFAILA